MAEIDFFRSLSAKYGLPLQFAIKEFYVMDLLAKIISAAQKETIVFKGGTALNRCYASGLSRFSEDLDFDYISSSTIKKKIRILQMMMKLDGYRIEKSRLFKNRLRFDCFFINDMGKKDVVRAEFNLSLSRIIGKVERKTVFSELSGKSIVGVPVYSLEDLVARKMLALHNRTEGKDIFDLANFIMKADKKPVKKSLNSMLKYEKSKKNSSQVIKECISKLESVDIKQVAALTNNYIPVSIRPEWHELTETLKMRLGQLLEK